MLYAAGSIITCPSPGQDYYGQDANYTINPMSYTKLDSSGSTLPDSATSWSMVKDNVTGLMWEVKTNKDGVASYNDPHDADNTYTWYDSNPATNGGNAGTYNNGQNTEACNFSISSGEMIRRGLIEQVLNRRPQQSEVSHINPYTSSRLTAALHKAAARRN